jgi:hypothetical protein
MEMSHLETADDGRIRPMVDDFPTLARKAYWSSTRHAAGNIGGTLVRGSSALMRVLWSPETLRTLAGGVSVAARPGSARRSQDYDFITTRRRAGREPTPRVLARLVSIAN